MKKFLIIAAMMVTVTSVHAETIYIAAGTAKYIHTEKAYKHIHVGNGELLTVNPGETDHDLIIISNYPDGVLVESSNVLLLDDKGQVVMDIDVEVTPFRKPSRTIRVLGPGLDTTYHCTSGTCINAVKDQPRGKGLGDADSISKTFRKDGSTSTWKNWTTPPIK